MERHETTLGPLGADLPEPAEETTESGAEAASGAEDAPGTASGDAESEQIEMTAPIFPAEMVLRDYRIWLQRQFGGGMILKISAAVATPMGKQPSPPVFAVDFDAAGWETFQAVVAAGEVPKPSRPSSIVVPAGPLPDGPRTAQVIR